VISAPHDGMFRPRFLPKRTKGVFVRDVGTKGLAATLALEALHRQGKRPHLLVCRLSRACIDVNRPCDQAESHPFAVKAWKRYHELLAKACRSASEATPGAALLIDVHAQGHWRRTGRHAVEIGTMFPTGRDLSKGRGHLDRTFREHLSALDGEVELDEHEVVERLCHFFSMPRLAAKLWKDRHDLPDLLLGPHSLGSLLNLEGIEAVPSEGLSTPPPVGQHDNEGGPQDGAVSPQELAYFAKSDSESSDNEGSSSTSCCQTEVTTPFFYGGHSYTLKTSHLTLDAIQTEWPSSLTKEPQNWAPLAFKFLNSLEAFWVIHTQQKLFPKPSCAQAVDVFKRQPGRIPRIQRLLEESCGSLRAADTSTFLACEKLSRTMQFQEMMKIVTADTNNTAWKKFHDAKSDVEISSGVVEKWLVTKNTVYIPDCDPLEAFIVHSEPDLVALGSSSIESVTVLEEDMDQLFVSQTMVAQGSLFMRIELHNALDEPLNSMVQIVELRREVPKDGVRSSTSLLGTPDFGDIMMMICWEPAAEGFRMTRVMMRCIPGAEHYVQEMHQHCCKDPGLQDYHKTPSVVEKHANLIKDKFNGPRGNMYKSCRWAIGRRRDITVDSGGVSEQTNALGSDP